MVGKGRTDLLGRMQRDYIYCPKGGMAVGHATQNAPASRDKETGWLADDTAFAGSSAVFSVDMDEEAFPACST